MRRLKGGSEPEVLAAEALIEVCELFLSFIV